MTEPVEEPEAPRRWPRSVTSRRSWLPAAGLAIAYIAGGRLGLTLDAVSGFATLVWPPTGLALAALLLFGRSLWPGVAIGAFTVNVLNGATVGLAASIAAGNTLQVLLAVHLLRLVPGFKTDLRRVRDILALLIIAGTIATMVSASVGTASLLVAGRVAANEVGLTWTAWWLGDAMGVLVLAPALLSWASRRPPENRVAEALAAGATLIGSASAIFLGPGLNEPLTFLQPYLLIAPFLWVAVRFEVQGAAAGILAVSILAVTGTVLGRGPFEGADLAERLWALQGFMGLIAVTFLVLGALASERHETERALVAAKEAAEASSGAKSRFLAVMSHELRTPLGAIIGHIDLLEAEIHGPVTEGQRRHLERVRGAAWHLVSIIDGILTFSRTEAGRESVQLESIDAVALAREVVALLEPQAAAKGLELRARHMAESIQFRSDPGKLRQILLNLAGNAVKYSERGTVEFELLEQPDCVVFVVRDQGMGIPADQLDTIFEPFQQVRRGSVSTGTGLGLSVSAMLTRLLGGSLNVESSVGRGSTFTLQLPRNPGGDGDRPAATG